MLHIWIEHQTEASCRGAADSPRPQEVQRPLQGTGGVEQLLLRSSLAAGLSVCASVQSVLHVDHSTVWRGRDTTNHSSELLHSHTLMNLST